MLDYHTFAKRLIAVAGLAVTLAGAASLGGTVAGADPAPPAASRATVVVLPVISPLFVRAGGTEAFVSFTTSVPTAVTYENRPVTAAPAAVHAPIHPAVASFGSVAARPGLVGELTDGNFLRQYLTSHEVKLTSLTSNTAYELSVVAETQSGERLTAQARFTTLKKRVKITLESIDIKDDGDGFLSGDGEPRWLVRPFWDGVTYTPARNGGALCFPNTNGRCDFGSYGSGRFAPQNKKSELLTIVFAEENFDRFPAVASLQSWAVEDDAIGGAWIAECLTGGCPVGDDAMKIDWQVPQGVESAFHRMTVRGDDASTGFESVLTFRFEVVHDDLSYHWHSRNLAYHNWYN